MSGLTIPEANIISSLITVIGALGAVVLGTWVFGGRVKDLKGALDQSQSLLLAHRENVEHVLSEVRASLGSLGEQFDATGASLAQLRGQVADLDSVTTTQEGVTDREINAREKLKDDWSSIRDVLELIAASPDLDGRRRAKYARIDRRQYVNFWQALNLDGELGDNGELFRKAIDLWHKYRNGRSTPSPADIQTMGQLREVLTRQGLYGASL